MIFSRQPLLAYLPGPESGTRYPVHEGCYRIPQLKAGFLHLSFTVDGVPLKNLVGKREIGSPKSGFRRLNLTVTP
jgi:hypothetical protein